MKQPQLLFIYTIVAVIASGLTQGYVQRRWSNDSQLAEASQALLEVPAAFGQWTSEELSLTETEISTGRIAGYIRREYQHQQTQSKVGVLLMVGEAGPISLHPPTVCLSGQGFQMLRQPSTFSLPLDGSGQSGETCRLFRADFQSARSGDDLLTRLYWGWSTTGDWQAATNPRFTFAGEPLLFKLYVTERWQPSETRKNTAVTEQFLKEFIPVVNRVISGQRLGDQAVAVSEGVK